jgi:tRNA (guanine-N7-)-methyltransferase
VYPASPDDVEWDAHYPAFAGTGKKPEFADVGCGFGGLLIALAPLYPDTLMLGTYPRSLTAVSFSFRASNRPAIFTGLEIRVQVSQYVEDRIAALRATSSAPPQLSTTGSGSTSASTTVPGGYQNVSIVRANAMKFLPNYFSKHSLSVLFFLFPDPHFKLRKHKARIISPTLLAEYAYALRPGGIVYTITDVKDLAEWMKAHISAFPLFESVDVETLRAEGKGPILDAVWNSTEEGKKVERKQGEKWLACFRRIELPRKVL